MNKTGLFILGLIVTLAFSVSAHAKNWDKGGKLHEKEMIMDWAISTEENILASCADYIKWTTAPQQLKDISADVLKQAASEVAACMAKVISPEIGRQNAHPYVLSCIGGLAPQYAWVHTKDYENREIFKDALSQTPEQEEKEWQEARANMVKVTTPVQSELKALYTELLAMRGSKKFVELGFSKNNVLASEWKAKVEAFRARIENNNDIPLQVRAAPAYLLTIGFDRAWRAGRTNADSTWNMQMINDGINWKLEE